MEPRTCFQKLQSIQKILDSELSHVEKLVLIKMAMYDDCYITNKWLSVTLGTTVRTIEKAIAVLKNKKIITVERIVRPGTKIQRRQVTNIDFDCLNVNTVKTQEKTQAELCDGLKKENVLKLQTELCDGLKLDKITDEQAQPSQQRVFQLQTELCDGLKPGGKDLKNGITKPTTAIPNTLSTYNKLYISNKKTVSNNLINYGHTNTKFLKRSDFLVNKSTDTTKKKKRFKKPTVEEIRQYCIERGNTIDPEYFQSWYASRGWLLSKGFPMVDWKAAVRTWEYRAKKWKEQEKKRKEEEKKQKKKEIVRLPTGQARQEYKQSWYDKDAEIRRAAVMAATKNDK